MTVRVGINGLGRIGRLVLRAGWGRPDIEFVHLNELACDAETTAHLLEFDTVHGRWLPNMITASADVIKINNHAIRYSRSTTIDGVDWHNLGIDLVLECTGVFKTPEALQPYLNNGVKRIVVAAPIKKDPILDIVYGINHNLYDPTKHKIVTAASCTTNCLAPVIKAVHETFGIERGSMTTIHNVTNTQVVVDAPHSDKRRARSALNALIPTTTGSATAITRIYPELRGKLNGHAVRVPLLNASLTDCVFELKKTATAEHVNAAFDAYANGELKNILGLEQRMLVSSDFTNDARSSIVDAPSTMVVDGTHLKVYAWYDNEWGYVNRMIDIVEMVRSQGL